MRFRQNFPITPIPYFSPFLPTSLLLHKNKFYAKYTPPKYLIFSNFKWNWLANKYFPLTLWHQDQTVGFSCPAGSRFQCLPVQQVSTIPLGCWWSDGCRCMAAARNPRCGLSQDTLKIYSLNNSLGTIDLSVQGKQIPKESEGAEKRF